MVRMESLPPHVACFGEARSRFETQLPTIAPVLSMSTMATCMAADSEENFCHGFGKFLLVSFLFASCSGWVSSTGHQKHDNYVFMQLGSPVRYDKETYKFLCWGKGPQPIVTLWSCIS